MTLDRQPAKIFRDEARGLGANLIIHDEGIGDHCTFIFGRNYVYNGQYSLHVCGYVYSRGLDPIRYSYEGGTVPRIKVQLGACTATSE